MPRFPLQLRAEPRLTGLLVTDPRPIAAEFRGRLFTWIELSGGRPTFFTSAGRPVYFNTDPYQSFTHRVRTRALRRAIQQTDFEFACDLPLGCQFWTPLAVISASIVFLIGSSWQQGNAGLFLTIAPFAAMLLWTLIPTAIPGLFRPRWNHLRITHDRFCLTRTDGLTAWYASADLELVNRTLLGHTLHMAGGKRIRLLTGRQSLGPLRLLQRQTTYRTGLLRRERWWLLVLYVVIVVMPILQTALPQLRPGAQPLPWGEAIAISLGVAIGLPFLFYRLGPTIERAAIRHARARRRRQRSGPAMIRPST